MGTDISIFAALALIAAILLLSGCGNMNPVNPPAVHAGPPPAFSCPVPAGFATSQESPGSYVAVIDTACALLGAGGETDTQRLDSCGVNQVITIVTTKDIHVHSIRLWIGAGFGSKFETGVCLEVITAGAVTHTFRQEWDKHIEEHYNDAPFPVDFIIPAGSTVRLSRDPHSTISCLDGVNASGVADGKTQGQCATQEMAELHGE